MLYSFIAHTAWAGSAPWTWLYRYSPPAGVQEYSRKKFIAERKHVSPFTQLIFSWNAQRPVQGKFVFWGRVRNARTKRWGDWHRMVDWGSDRQITHCSVRPKGSSYNYVRLEAPQGEKADAFRIKVEGVGGAVLQDFSQLNVCLSNLSDFAIEKMATVHALPSVKVNGVPAYSQMEVDSPDAARICSPTSMSMLLGYLNKNDVDPRECARYTYDPGLDTFGSWPFNVAHAYTACDTPRNFYVRRLPSFVNLHSFLAKGVPVVASIRGQLRGMPAGHTYSQGHLLVVVGWDKKNKRVLCHDPAFPMSSQVPNSYDATDFVRAWERSRRLSYLAEPTPIS